MYGTRSKQRPYIGLVRLCVGIDPHGQIRIRPAARFGCGHGIDALTHHELSKEAVPPRAVRREIGNARTLADRPPAVGVASRATIVSLMFANPAFAQSIDLSPVQNLLQGIVDTITGPLGIVIGTLALIGVFLTWLFGMLDFRQALWVLVAIAGIAAAPTIVTAIWAA
ncbi:Type IV secretory pathway, VirB2 components (pilins) [Celeribacter marinus]|nr:Type IV secretory pathway, VirB2 components (pilins) [Celeribacter marinus]